jgi:hypothetical protein
LNKAALLLGLTDAQMSVFLRMAVPQIADMLLTPLKIDTEILDLKDAKDFHSYYNSTRNPDQSLSVDTTRAVYFTLKEILSSLATLYRTDSIPDLNNAALYAYLLRYSKNGSSRAGNLYYENQISVAIQLAEDRGTADPIVHIGKIFNYGDLCPPRCPINEEIK